MTALMEGVTLGTLDYVPTGAATGYVAFLALTLYLDRPPALAVGRRDRRGRYSSVGNPPEPDELDRDLPRFGASDRRSTAPARRTAR